MIRLNMPSSLTKTNKGSIKVLFAEVLCLFSLQNREGKKKNVSCGFSNVVDDFESRSSQNLRSARNVASRNQRVISGESRDVE